MEQQIIDKLNLFITELEACTINDEFENIKSRIKSYIIGLYGNNHSLSKAGELNEELEDCDYYGLYSHSRNGEWIDTSAPENRVLTKDKKPLIAHTRKIIEIINKDGLPLNMKPTVMINMEHCPGANVAACNMGHTTQSSSVSTSDFNRYYASAIKEVGETIKLTKEQKEELLDMLALFKESVDRDETPKKTILKTLGNYSLYTTSFGANMVTLWTFIEPYINQLPK